MKKKLASFEYQGIIGSVSIHGYVTWNGRTCHLTETSGKLHQSGRAAFSRGNAYLKRSGRWPA